MCHIIWRGDWPTSKLVQGWWCWYDDVHHRHAWWRQRLEVTVIKSLSVWCVFVHNWTTKSGRNTKKLSGQLSVPQLTFCTSSMVRKLKVKVTRRLNAVTENQPYFGTGRPTNFKLGIRMDYDDPHHRHARWPQRSPRRHNGTRKPASVTCALVSKLKVLGGRWRHHLQGAGAYCGGRTACSFIQSWIDG